MSKRLEFDPNQDFKPRKPQAVEISGSRPCILHPAGDVGLRKVRNPPPKFLLVFILRLLPLPPSLFSSSPFPTPKCLSSNQRQAWND